MHIRYALYADHVRHFIRQAAPPEALGRNGDGIAWFARQIGAHPSALSRVLNGRVDLTHEMGARIANGLGVDHQLVYRAEVIDDDVQEAAR